MGKEALGLLLAGLLGACDSGGAVPPEGAADMRLIDMTAPMDGAAMDAQHLDVGLPTDVGSGIDGAIADAVAIDRAVPDAAVTPGCGAYAPPEETGTLGDPQLTEVSGIAASRQPLGFLWLHNDSGDGAILYAVGEDGGRLGRLNLPMDVNDLEDIALARCPDGQGDCLWLADIGDNSLNRPSVAVHALREPTVEGPFPQRRAELVHTFTVRYPDGRPHDAEALAVTPTGDRFFIITKTADQPHVFSWETAQPGPGALTDHGGFDAPGVPVPMGRLVTGADLHPEGGRLALRVYTGSYEYRFGPGQDARDLAAIHPITVAIGPLSEPQGEAIAYTRDGNGLWTVSEFAAGGQPLHRYRCR